ncbi:hypothetical protein Vretimale_12030, partial [Volvox reticuliferus]
GGDSAAAATLRAAAERLLRRVTRCCLDAASLELSRLNADHVIALMDFWRTGGLKLRGSELLPLLGPSLAPKQRGVGLRVIRAALGYGQEEAVLYGEAREQIWRAIRALLSGSKPPGALTAPALRLVAVPLGEMLGLYLARLAAAEKTQGQGGGGGGGGGQPVDDGGTGSADAYTDVEMVAASSDAPVLGQQRQRQTNFGSVLEAKQYDIQVCLRRATTGNRNWEGLVHVLMGLSAPPPLGHPPSALPLLGDVVRGLGAGALRETACGEAFCVIRRCSVIAPPGQARELFIELLTAVDRLPLRTMRPETQREAFEVLQALVPFARLEDLVSMLRNLLGRGLAAVPSPMARLAFIQLCTGVWQHQGLMLSIGQQKQQLQGKGEGQTHAQATLSPLVLPVLAGALGDTDPRVSVAARTFWHNLLPTAPMERLAALLRLASHPALSSSSNTAAPTAVVSESASRLLARWPNVACALLLQPSLVLTDNDQPLYTSQPYECTFRDYTPSLGLYGGVGTLASGSGTAAAAALRTPAFLLTQDMYGGGGTATLTRRRPHGLIHATATSHFVPTMSLSAIGDVFAPPAPAATGGSTLVGASSVTQSVPSASMAESATPRYGSGSHRTVRLAARSQQSSSRYSRTAAIRGMQQRELSMRAIRRHGRTARVQLFRSYRTGELPDTLSVRVLSFLRPLAGVVETDGPAAIAALAALAAALAAAATGGGTDAVSRPSLRVLHDALLGAFAARPAAPSYVTALQAVATRFIDADGGGGATAPLLLSTADLTAAAAANSGYGATAVLLEAQQSALEKELEARSNAAAAATAAATAAGSDLYDRSGSRVAAAAKRAAIGLSTTLEALAHLYAELDEQDVVFAVRRRLLQCPGTFAMLTAEAAGRPRLAVRRAGQLRVALDLLKELGPNVASELVPERSQDQGLVLGSGRPQPQQREGEEEAGSGGGASGVEVPTVSRLLGAAVMTRGSAAVTGGSSAAACVVSPVEAALWRETVASCADALGDWSRLAAELERPLADLGVQLPDGGGGGGGGLFASAANVIAVAENLPRRLLLTDGGTPADAGSSSSSSSSSGKGAAVLLRRVLRSALFQLSEEDFQMSAAAQLQGGGGSGSAAAAADSEPSEGPALLVLRLLQQLDNGGGGGDREVASYAASAAPLELVAAEVYRACWRGSWERCLSVLQSSLGRLRARWSGLHPLATAARISTLTVLQPLAEIQEMVRQLQSSRSWRAAAASNGCGATESSAAAAVRHLQTLVDTWQRRGMGAAVAAAAAAAGSTGPRAGRNPTGTGSALNTLMQVRRLLVDAAASCILPRTVSGDAVLPGELQRAARSAHSGMRLAAAEAAVHAGCADTAAETLPPPPEPLAEDDIRAADGAAAAGSGPGSDARQAARQAVRQLRLFRTHVDTIAAQAAAEPSDCVVYDAVSELLSAMRPWHKRTHRQGLLLGRLAADSHLTQSQALLVLSGDPRPAFQKFLRARVAAALGSAAAASAFDPPPTDFSSRQQQRHHHHGPQYVVSYEHGSEARGGDEGSFLGDSDAATAARASAHFALLCGRLMRATHGSVADCALESATPSLEELLDTPQKKQVAAAVRAGGGDLPACIVRHLLRAMALAGSGTRGSGGGSGGGGGGGGSEAIMELRALAAHLHLQLPAVLSVLRASDAAAEAFRQSWSAVPLGLFLPWVGQMTSMVSDTGGGASGGGGSGGGASGGGSGGDDPLLGPLTALAHTYPQRLYAPLRMMGGGGGGGGCRNRTSTPAVAAVMAPLLAATESPVVSEFVDALEQMTYPAQRWQVFTSRITQALARADIEAAVTVWTQEAWPSLFGRYQSAASAGQPAAAAAAALTAAAPPLSRRQFAGAVPPAEPYNVAFARRYRDTFEEVFGGADGAGLRQLAERTRQQFYQQQPSPPPPPPPPQQQ